MRHCRSHTPIVRNIRMMTRIPALVVGTGFGCRTHVPALRAAGFDVVGLVGADAARTARRAEKSGIVPSYPDLDDAITPSSPRVVPLAPPPHPHPALAPTPTPPRRPTPLTNT